MAEWEFSPTVHCRGLRFSVKVKAGSSNLRSLYLFVPTALDSLVLIVERKYFSNKNEINLSTETTQSLWPKRQHHLRINNSDKMLLFFKFIFKATLIPITCSNSNEFFKLI